MKALNTIGSMKHAVTLLRNRKVPEASIDEAIEALEKAMRNNTKVARLFESCWNSIEGIPKMEARSTSLLGDDTPNLRKELFGTTTDSSGLES